MSYDFYTQKFENHTMYIWFYTFEVIGVGVLLQKYVFYGRGENNAIKESYIAIKFKTEFYVYTLTRILVCVKYFGSTES